MVHFVAFARIVSGRRLNALDLERSAIAEQMNALERARAERKPNSYPIQSIGRCPVRDLILVRGQFDPHNRLFVPDILLQYPVRPFRGANLRRLPRASIGGGAARSGLALHPALNKIRRICGWDEFAVRGAGGSDASTAVNSPAYVSQK
jgi:hypothetical protein